MKKKEFDFIDFWSKQLPKKFMDEFWNKKLEKELMKSISKFGNSGVFKFVEETLPILDGKKYKDFMESAVKICMEEGKEAYPNLNKFKTQHEKRKYAKSLFYNRITNPLYNLLENLAKKKPRLTCKYCHKKFKISIPPLHLDPKEFEYCEDCLNLAFKSDIRRYLGGSNREGWWIQLKAKKKEYGTPAFIRLINGKLKRKHTKEVMINNLKKLINILGFIPPPKYKEFIVNHYDKKELHKFLPLLIEMPPYDIYEAPLIYIKRIAKCKEIKTYKKVFGSWFKALIGAHVLEGDVRKTSRGTICLAKDGHQCNSIAEKNIDDWLFSKDIEHEKEPVYPKDEDLNPRGLFRGDWLIKGVYVEYFGLKGSKDYDIKIELKKEILKKTKKRLIEIYPSDLYKLSKKFKKIYE